MEKISLLNNKSIHLVLLTLIAITNHNYILLFILILLDFWNCCLKLFLMKQHSLVLFERCYYSFVRQNEM